MDTSDVGPRVPGVEEMTSRERLVKQLELQAMYLRSRESMLAVLVASRGLVMVR